MCHAAKTQLHNDFTMRISVKKHNIAYLQELALQMNLTDITEVLNYLLLDVKGLGYKFGDKAVPHPITQVPIGYSFNTPPLEPTFVPIQECDTKGELLFERLRQRDRNYSEDPIIARMSQLIEEF